MPSANTSRVEFVESQSQNKATPGEDGDEKVPSQDASATPAGDDMDVDEDESDAKKSRQPSFSREEEIEKLLTVVSMTQNPAESSRIRNISKVQFGKYDLYPWYFSPYPEAFSLEDVVYICEFCLGY